MTLKRLRKAAGFTQEEVARELELSLGNYRRWETVGLPAQVDRIIKLCKMLKCKPEDLIK